MIEPGSINGLNNTDRAKLDAKKADRAESGSANRRSGGPVADSFSSSAPNQAAPVYTSAGITSSSATNEKAQSAARQREAQSDIDADEAESLVSNTLALFGADSETAAVAQSAGLNEARVLELIA
ncbi:hypothetical protein [Acanthopleuribacter pedis]|uniref:Uncharacterized protein n=1 Tax=Acanthopleuribacter pedis TaxID=442870 RepID=A0A8J7U2W9_9BACT|nr:hypothetical protein [Acanthopleuribacter pedis]MBO1318179.1 hypothetical protein [Acanthopleuribacter pedis]